MTEIRVSALLDSAGDGILILDSGLKIERANPAFGFLYGKPAESFIGLNHEEVIKWNKIPIGPTLEDSVTDGWPLAQHSTLYVEGDLARGTDYSSIAGWHHLCPVTCQKKGIFSILLPQYGILPGFARPMR